MAALVLMTMVPAGVRADCAAIPYTPPTPESVRGVTFSGTVTGVRRDDPERYWDTYVFAVDSVWAGPVVPRIEVVSYTCAQRLKFEVGQAYLLSWDEGGGGFDHPTENDASQWRSPVAAPPRRRPAPALQRARFHHPLECRQTASPCPTVQGCDE